MITRDIEEILIHYASMFPVLAILGPRQSGKTTAAKKVFSKYTYVLLEEPDQKTLANKDPRGFLKEKRNEFGLILDEIQEAPQLLSYIQGIVDNEERPGQFIITGSQNFAFNQAITQTLAGRVGMITLLPLSISELTKAHILPDSYEELIVRGAYPRMYNTFFVPEIWYPSYIKNYVERDVRQIVNIENLSAFQEFVGLCAGRIGQLLNLSSLGNDCGISHTTARSWLSLLEASYIVFLLQPYYKNFSKRIIKSPKIYFYDTGLACSLLKIHTAQQLKEHYLRGGLFESLIVSELIKNRYNQGKESDIYFWRDSQGNEIDILIEKANNLIPLEIKSSYTITSSFFKSFEYWKNISKESPKKASQGIIVYAGDQEQEITDIKIMNWKKIGSIK